MGLKGYDLGEGVAACTMEHGEIDLDAVEKCQPRGCACTHVCKNKLDLHLQSLLSSRTLAIVDIDL